MANVSILMATRNGAAHVQAQLESFAAQTHGDWTLRVSDDGSTDLTREIVSRFRLPDGSAPDLRTGPQAGSPAANFLALLTAPDLPGDAPVALSDQDDVWMPDKLARALSVLEALPHDRPALYCSTTILVSPDLRRIGPSRRHRVFGFGNAVVQNVVAGNTTVLNPAALALVRAAGPVDVPYHDWWLYLLLSGAGAKIVHDPRPGLLYRQHGANDLGENRSLSARRRRAGLVGDGTWRGWLNRNLAALSSADHLLTPDARARLAAAGPLPADPAKARRAWLSAMRPYRQHWAETAALYASVVAGRV